MNTKELLDSRAKAHGDYHRSSNTRMEMQLHLDACPSSDTLYNYPELGRSIMMIMEKLTRIMYGNPLEAEHWKDIIGYATLALETLEDESTNGTI